jgi:predicted dithiol-disulfide oxidoreductase (DUF899 family)
VGRARRQHSQLAKIDAARQHFEHADLAFAAISRASLERIEAVKECMGRTFPRVFSNWSAP